MNKVMSSCAVMVTVPQELAASIDKSREETSSQQDWSSPPISPLFCIDEDAIIPDTWNPCLYSLQMKAPKATPLKCGLDVDETYDVFGDEYHGLISKAEAVDYLFNQTDGAFLVRKTMAGKFILSLNFNNAVMNYTIKISDSHFIYGDKVYETILELVNDCLIILYIEKHEDVNLRLSQGRHQQKTVHFKRRQGGQYRRRRSREGSRSSIIENEMIDGDDNSPPDDDTLKTINWRVKSLNYSGEHKSPNSSLKNKKNASAGNLSELHGMLTDFTQASIALATPKVAALSPSCSRSNSSSSYEKCHNFSLCTFKAATWCDVCHHFIWGLKLQGHCCQDCGINVHKQCVELAQSSIECIPNRKMIKKVFGTDLTALVMVEGNSIPLFLQLSVTIVETSYVQTEGLYRVSGITSRVIGIKEKFDEGKLQTLDDDHEVHVITGAIKLYFRELPIPLITYDVYPKVIQAVKDHPTDIDEFCSTIKQILSNELPKSHYDTLYFFIQHLQRVALHSDVNKMKSSNLAVVFAPTLMRSLDDDSILNLATLQYEQKFIERLITHADNILC